MKKLSLVFLLILSFSLKSQNLPSEEEKKQHMEEVRKNIEAIQQFFDTLKPFEEITSTIVLSSIPSITINIDNKELRIFGSINVLIREVWLLLLELEHSFIEPSLSQSPPDVLNRRIIKDFISWHLKSMEISWNYFLNYFYSIEKPQEEEKIRYARYLASQATIPLLTRLLQHLFNSIPLLSQIEVRSEELIKQFTLFKQELNNYYSQWCRDDKNAIQCKLIQDVLNSRRLRISSKSIN